MKVMGRSWVSASWHQPWPDQKEQARRASPRGDDMECLDRKSDVNMGTSLLGYQDPE